MVGAAIKVLYNNLYQNVTKGLQNKSSESRHPSISERHTNTVLSLFSIQCIHHEVPPPSQKTQGKKVPLIWNIK